ncbi:MAG: hypothetical protein KJO22_04660, partial [Bacteroidia bacterium]|nr:hypothetical protein [Bacteroidia bacterium]
MSAKAQILQQSNQQNDSSSGSWNKLPFIEEKKDDKPLILVEPDNAIAKAPPRKKRKKKITVATNEIESDSLQKDSLVQAELIRDSILALEKNTATTANVEPSFFQGHQLT